MYSALFFFFFLHSLPILAVCTSIESVTHQQKGPVCVRRGCENIGVYPFLCATTMLTFKVLVHAHDIWISAHNGGDC